jgi:hypothetical protein
MKRLSQNEIEEEIMSTIQTTEEKELSEKALSAHQEALKPKKQPLQNDFMSKPGRWNGVQGGPLGLKKSS